MRGALMGIMVCLCFGCEGQHRLGPIPAPITRDEALGRYNGRVHAMGAFRAKVKHWEAKFRDEHDDENRYDGNGLKLYYHPALSANGRGRLYLQLDNLLFKRAMVIGSNEEEYWAYCRALESGGWGKYIHRGKTCAEGLLVDPDMLLHLIGVKPIPATANESPYPLYKVGAEENSIQYVTFGDDGLEVLCEITTDRRTDLPRAIVMYDRQGQIVQRSRLSDYQEIESARLPGDIVISSGSDDSYFHLKLQAYTLDEDDRSKYFRRPEKPPGIKDYRQIDQQCEDD